MTRRRLALVVCAAFVLVGCDKNTDTTPPDTTAVAETAPSSEGGGDGASGADDGASTADDAADPAGDDGAGEPAAGDGGTGAVAVADSGGQPASDEGGDDGEPDATESDDDGGDTELPSPVYTKVKASCGKDPGVGEKLKAFSLPSTTEGKTISNGSYRGRVVLVNFWGTWCKPCLQELPKFAQLYRRYRKHGMTLLAIATDEDRDAVVDTLSKKKIAAKVAIAGEEYAGKYESPQFPFTFVVDHNGVIQASYFGYEPDCMGKLEEDIRKQLEKRAKSKAK